MANVATGTGWSESCNPKGVSLKGAMEKERLHFHNRELWSGIEWRIKAGVGESD